MRHKFWNPDNQFNSLVWQLVPHLSAPKNNKSVYQKVACFCAWCDNFVYHGDPPYTHTERTLLTVFGRLLFCYGLCLWVINSIFNCRLRTWERDSKDASDHACAVGINMLQFCFAKFRGSLTCPPICQCQKTIDLSKKKNLSLCLLRFLIPSNFVVSPIKISTTIPILAACVCSKIVS